MAKKKDWDEMSRNEKIGGLVGLVVIALILVFIFNALTNGGGSKTKSVSKPAQVTQKPAPKTTETPESLKAQAVTLLTDATTYYQHLYDQVQADAVKPDAVNASSDFYKDKHTFDTTVDKTGITAFNKVSNSYDNNHLQQPASLDSWSIDSEKLYNDITTWTNDQYFVLVEQRSGGTATQAHIAKVTTDEDAFISDFAKVKADIAQL